MTKVAHGVPYLTVLLLACLSACGGSDAAIPTASCQACGITVNEEVCTRAGEANGCETSSFTPKSGSQCAGCKFTNCDEPPSCDTTAPARDAGSKEDDPACKTADADG